MIPLVFLLAGLYEMPDVQGLAAPDAVQTRRLDAALATIRTGADDDVDRAVREIALIGEVALPAVVARLNEAGGAERLLLLAAVRKMPRAAPLLAQARSDPHPAVRAYVTGPPPRAPVDLRLLARRYLDALALAEEKLRKKVDEDYAGRLPHWVTVSGDEMWGRMRARMRDRKVADQVQRRRTRAAREFAIAGGRALREGALAPDLDDPVFVAYVGLLGEEGGAFFHAVTGLATLGEKVAPALETLLRRPNHEPQKIARLLFAAAPDRVAPVYAAFSSYGAEAQRTLVTLAPSRLGDGLLPFLEQAALAPDDSVRSDALDELLALDAPAGAAIARKLLDPNAYVVSDFKRAARLLARAGDLEPLADLASIVVPDDGTELAANLGNLKRACWEALRRNEGPGLAPIAGRLLASERPALRTLAVDLLHDPARLLEVVRTEPDQELAKIAANRLLTLYGAAHARAVIAALRLRGLAVSWRLVHLLRDAGAVDLLVELAAGPKRKDALHALADLPAIDPKHEAALLAIHDAAPGHATLAALLPLGTPEVRRRYIAAGPDALSILAPREHVPFAIPLLPLLEGADATRLSDLARVADALPEVEPGFFHALVQAWDALPHGEREKEGGLDSGAAQEKGRLLDALARSSDKKSAQLLFDELLAGKIKEESLVLGICKAAACHLPPAQIARIVPLLSRLAKEEYPDEDKVAPPFSNLRYHTLRGGINALAWAHAEEALPFLCDLILDPNLHQPAFDWKVENRTPWLALEALRHFERGKVDAAFRAALARAEADGRLAKMHPGRLFWAVKVCRQGYFENSGRARGRWLPEVALALTEVLERLPWEGDVTYERGLALSGVGRYEEAAAVMRDEAARRRARGYVAEDGYWTPDRLEKRAVIYDALAAKSKEALGRALDDMADEPFLLYIVAFHLLHTLPDLALAGKAAKQSVRATGELYHLCRTWLGGVRVAQGRPKEAIDWIDPTGRVPVKRVTDDRWHLLFLAQAYLQIGEELDARHALERALDEDRRILPYARRLPEFQRFAKVFETVDRDFLDRLFEFQYQD